MIKTPDLTRWPIPSHSPLDAGAFVTAGVVIARDPETGRHNLSYNRMQIYGPDRTGISMNIWRHVKGFFDKIEPRGENLPFCVPSARPTVMMPRLPLLRRLVRHRGLAARGRYASRGRSPATSWSRRVGDRAGGRGAGRRRET